MGKKKWDHDKDFQDDVVKTASTQHEGEQQYECSVDYRNTQQPTHLFIVYTEGNLHVYVKKDGDKDWTFCLGVHIGLKIHNKYHLAFTAMTGQVADSHDVIGLTTRYLDEDDAIIDDGILLWAKEKPAESWGSMLYWIFQMGLSVGLLWETWAFQRYYINEF